MLPSVPNRSGGLRIPPGPAQCPDFPLWRFPRRTSSMLRPPARSSGDYNLDALDRRPAPPVLAGEDDRLRAPAEGGREILERAVRLYIGNLLAINDQCRARLRTSGDLYHVTMQLSAADFKEHLLALALCRERKLERIARRAHPLLGICSEDIPEVVARVKSGDFSGRGRQLAVLDNPRKHRGGADAQLVADRLRYRLPF